MNEILPVVTTFLLGWLLVLLFWGRWRWLAPAMALGYLLRCAVALVHAFLIELPQGASDARVFDATAVEWSIDGCFAFFNHFDPAASYVYSAFLASLYGCFGASSLAAQLLNCVLGTATIGVAALAARSAWGESVASRVALLVAVFPSLVLFSAMTLREAAIVLVFSIGVFFIVQHSIGRRLGSLLLACLAFALAAFLHGAMAIAMVAFLAAVVFRKLAVRNATSRSLAMNALLVSFALVPSAAILYLYSDLIFIPKIGLIGEIDSEALAGVLSSRAQGDAAYLIGLAVGGPLDVIWQAPLRTVYLLFAPFPWNIGSPAHLFGLADGMIYLWIAIRLKKEWRRLRQSPVFFPLLAVVICLALVFAFGTSNFGTGMRHRAKFVVALLVLAAPALWSPGRWARGGAAGTKEQL